MIPVRFHPQYKKITISPDYKIISLDAVSLFTNVQIRIAITGIKNRWQQIQPYTKLPWH